MVQLQVTTDTFKDDSRCEVVIEEVLPRVGDGPIPNSWMDCEQPIIFIGRVEDHYVCLGLHDPMVPEWSPLRTILGANSRECIDYGAARGLLKSGFPPLFPEKQKDTGQAKSANKEALLEKKKKIIQQRGATATRRLCGGLVGDEDMASPTTPKAKRSFVGLDATFNPTKRILEPPKPMPSPAPSESEEEDNSEEESDFEYLSQKRGEEEDDMEDTPSSEDRSYEMLLEADLWKDPPTHKEIEDLTIGQWGELSKRIEDRQLLTTYKGLPNSVKVSARITIGERQTQYTSYLESVREIKKVELQQCATSLEAAETEYAIPGNKKKKFLWRRLSFWRCQSKRLKRICQNEAFLWFEDSITSLRYFKASKDKPEYYVAKLNEKLLQALNGSRQIPLVTSKTEQVDAEWVSAVFRKSFVDFMKTKKHENRFIELPIGNRVDVEGEEHPITAVRWTPKRIRNGPVVLERDRHGQLIWLDPNNKNLGRRIERRFPKKKYPGFFLAQLGQTDGSVVQQRMTEEELVEILGRKYVNDAKRIHPGAEPWIHIPPGRPREQLPMHSSFEVLPPELPLLAPPRKERGCPQTHFLQEQSRTCLHRSFASCVHHLGWIRHAHQIIQVASQWEAKYGMMEALLARAQKIGLVSADPSAVVRYGLGELALLDDISYFPTTMVLEANDGGVDHAVTVWGKWIFDSNLNYAFALNRENLDWCCSSVFTSALFRRVHSAVRFKLSTNVESRKRERVRTKAKNKKKRGRAI